MTRKEQIIDEVRRLPAPDRMEIVQGLLDLVAPPLSAEQEQGLAEAIDEADRGELVDGSEAFAQQRRRIRGAYWPSSSSPGRPQQISKACWTSRVSDSE
jgi:hypothetical protein